MGGGRGVNLFGQAGQKKPFFYDFPKPVWPNLTFFVPFFQVLSAVGLWLIKMRTLAINTDWCEEGPGDDEKLAELALPIIKGGQTTIAW